MASAFKIAIVGSGPAGMSAAGRAAQLGLSHILLEKTDHLSDTIYKYQKGKHVMATPSQLVLRSDMNFDAGKREKILGVWDEEVAAQKVNVKYNAEVKKITGQKGDFTLALTNGEEIKAEHVILGVGTQGNPNKMRCEGGDLPHIQYTLDDPGEYVDEHITVIGSGDAGIENAVGLAADPEQNNTVTILNRSAEFARAKQGNIDLILEAGRTGRVNVMCETTPLRITPGWLHLETRDGEQKIKCDRIIARMGTSPPRKFVEDCGISFTSDDKDAYPALSPQFETSVAGIYVIGALAGYPLIKHCMNQGYDVIEFINGNTDLKPADEPILEEKFAALPGARSVTEWLAFLRRRVSILNDLSMLQMREFLLDSEPRAYRAGDIVFQRNEPGASLFAIADGSLLVEIDPNDPSRTVPIARGSIVGEVGLISGRKRSATVRTAEGAIVVEIPRTASLKLIATNTAAKKEITRISTERQLLQLFPGTTPDDLKEVLETAEIKEIRAGQTIINEGDEGYDIFVIRQGSMVVEKAIGGKPVFLSYLPAGSYVGEMALIDGGRRTATVRAAIKSEVIKLDGDAFKRLLQGRPALLAKFKDDMAARQQTTGFIEAKKQSFSGAVDMYSQVAGFLVENGIGEATDVLLIDEKLCIGCDNCERACADSHEGLSRLDREAGRTYAHLHVPTSCRHCEHPHCMADCPPNALNRGPDGEVYINDTCIGCGNCQRNCPYGVIRMAKPPPKKPSLLSWLFFGKGPGPGEPDKKWTEGKVSSETPKKAIKCDMCSGIEGGPACVRACPTGAAIRVSPEEFLTVARMGQGG
ncbi:NAD(P)-binding domain-containing protein [Sphingosinicella sp. LHD-64]|uniref:cyclic nucleotide-binding domain-containing protein n=1 Tax=Sphingosinicella sp. LHD-64 TaxID=3072139 RepID=UPI00280FE65A|nr:cyclic nucleotide-binding domain-containing protein [Sphingosinicella sp. LHD-64]MDQ8757656.1 NAD(P)-binding domain-containing protein [Sphingosinicella sp. LHD-64]